MLGAVRAQERDDFAAGERAENAALLLAENLRNQVPSLHVLTHCGGGSFKSQLKKADASGSRFTLIVGESELAAGQVAVKNMATGEQTVHGLFDVLALSAALHA